MDEIKFKKENKFPACDRSPLEFLIPFNKRPEVMRAIKQESLDKYGDDLYECPKRLVCFGNCLGRPLPDVPSAAPYLAKLKETQQFNAKGELLVTGCSGCPIKASCTKVCPTVNSYLNRLNKPEATIASTPLVPFEKGLESAIEAISPLFLTESVDLTIPWDCITPKKAEVIKTYLYKNRDFQYIADSMGYSNGAQVKYIFYSSLTRLNEFAIMRNFIKSNKANLTEKQITVLEKLYLENKNYNEIGKELGLTKASISNIMKRIKQTNPQLKFNVYVKKIKGKPVYQVPEVLK